MSSLFGLNILLNTLFSNTLGLLALKLKEIEDIFTDKAYGT
jgi:hypothetical protein